MAPSNIHEDITYVRVDRLSDYEYANRYQAPKPKYKEETEEEKIVRISREKMFASWKTYDKVDINIIKVKQLCKPRHRHIINRGHRC